MKILAAVLLFATTFAFAAPKKLTGAAADLDKEMDARAKKIGNVGPANAPFAALAQKKGLIRIAFGDVGAIEHAKDGTAFIGRRPTPNGFEFARVIFAGAVDVSTRSAVVAIGSIIGAQEMVNKTGQKAVLPVFQTRVLGVIDGGISNNGVLSFPAKSPIRIYEAAAPKKGAGKK